MYQPVVTAMNGDIPSVPIITLAGVSSLTNVLLELPLPTALPQTVANKTLLYHPRIIADVQRVLLGRPDGALVQQLCAALRKTNTDHIELNDGLLTGVVDTDSSPLLLKALLAQDPTVFQPSASATFCLNAVTQSNSGYNFPQHHAATYQNSGGSEMLGYAAPVNDHPFDRFNNMAAYQEQGLAAQTQQPSTDYMYSVNGISAGQSHSKPAAMGQFTAKTPVACSPAQAAAAPVVAGDQSTRGMNVHSSPYSDGQTYSMQSHAAVAAGGGQQQQFHPGAAAANDNIISRSSNLVPTISLTRVDDTLLKEHKKHHRDRHGNSTIPTYNVVSSDNHQKLTLKLSKNKDEQQQQRGSKRCHPGDDDSEDCEYDGPVTMAQMQEVYGEFATSLTERVKRRRNKVSSYRDDEDSDADSSSLHSSHRHDVTAQRHDPSSRQPPPSDDASISDTSNSSFADAARRAKKEKKPVRRLMEVSVCLEELMDTPTFKRFNNVLDNILEAAEDMDLASIRDDDDDDGTTNTESAGTKSQLAELCSEAAKLKSMGVMNQLPCEKLIKALTILQFNIRDGCKIIPAVDPDGDTDDDHLWRELAFERVISALDASLTALYIMTSSNMPKEVFIEDVIDKVVRMTKMQLYNAVYPEFDPVYRVDPHNKTGVQSNMKMKRAKSSGTKDRTVLAIYNKLTELTALLAELVDVQDLTDTIVLQISTLAVSPFFVENVSEIQLNALKLVTCIFSHYEKHRQLILEDILSSLARLPSSKKNLRSYRLNADEQIQMVTALALQLIQCVVKLPSATQDDIIQPSDDDPASKKKRNSDIVDKEVMILTSYETAMRTAHNFLAVFLAKCTSKAEDDYRPLFENFVYDLLSTVNKPEWPAAELILSLLGNLLVKQFSCKSVEMSLRVASLDYLGIVAARLRRDAVSSQLNEDIISDIIHQMDEANNAAAAAAGNTEVKTEQDSKKPNNGGVVNLTERLQKALLQYLMQGADNDPSLIFVRQFYIAQWYRDCTMEAEKAAKKLADGNTGVKKAATQAVPEKKQKKRRRIHSSDEESDVDVNDSDDNDDSEDESKKAARKAAAELDAVKDIQTRAEQRKNFLMQLIATRTSTYIGVKKTASKLDYKSALLVTRYLASNRPFSQSFDIYLTQILKVLCETAVQVRTKALKCLTAVIEADPAILARTDMQVGVHGRFMDQSTAVREAAIELVGKFILIRPELTAQYYDMLSERILDTGISVRKRVIKIFRDICMEQPEFPKIPEMCVKMIRRVNDEEGIRKLVNETFQSMWFTAAKGSKEVVASRLLQRVMNITDVVAACRDSGFEWLEQLLDNLLKKEEDQRDKPIENCCKQIVDCLVENVLRLEEKTATGVNESSRSNSSRLVACFSTLYLFCKVKPSLLMYHCTTIQPYLDIKCTSQEDMMLLSNVTRILELSVPLMDHPSESFLAQLEEDMMKLILKHGMMIIQSCVSCLGAVVNGVTHNYKLVKDCFQKFFGVLSKIQSDHQVNERCAHNRPTLLRALFTVGLLCKNFDFDSEDFGEKKVSIRDRVFAVLLYFMQQHSEEEVQLKALTGLGFLVTRHYEFMLNKELRDLYHHLLTSEDAPVRMCCQVLRNLQTYLVEEELKMMKADAEWRKVHDKEDLKELGDVQSGMASTIIQVYLKQVLESFYHIQSQVRMSALEVVVLILRQGLVHPVHCVPYLICMGSDSDTNIRLKADQQLLEIDKKYPGFIQMKAMQGIKMSYRLQEMLQRDCRPLRGMRVEDNPTSLNSYIYSLIRGNRSQRRGLLTSLLNMFDDTARTPLKELIYVADNLAYFPYQQQDEPLFIMHQLDIIVSVSGSNLLQSFRELFYPNSAEHPSDPNDPVDPGGTITITEDGEHPPAVSLTADGTLVPDGSAACSGGTADGTTAAVPKTTFQSRQQRQDEEDEENIDTLFELLSDEALSALHDLYLTAQGCVLLLVLKQHLKDTYGFTDSKIQRYSPTDSAKTFDKPLNRKNGIRFQPKQAIDIVQRGSGRPECTEQNKRQLVESYLDFRQLMLSIDPDDPDDDDTGLPNGSVMMTPSVGSRTVLVDPETGLPTIVPDADTPQQRVSHMGITPSSILNRHRGHHVGGTSERRRGRPAGTPSSSVRPKTNKLKSKKKKKRWNAGSDSDSDDCDVDPDWG